MTTQLTPREAQLLRLVSVGLRGREVADTMGICWDTYKTYNKHIRQKMQASTTLHAVAIAIRTGVIQ